MCKFNKLTLLGSLNKGAFSFTFQSERPPFPMTWLERLPVPITGLELPFPVAWIQRPPFPINWLEMLVL